jgi:hypothetical protein
LERPLKKKIEQKHAHAHEQPAPSEVGPEVESAVPDDTDQPRKEYDTADDVLIKKRNVRRSHAGDALSSGEDPPGSLFFALAYA